MSGIARVVVMKTMSDADSDLDFWLSRPVEERLAALVEMRREFEGWTVETEPGLPISVSMRCLNRGSARDQHHETFPSSTR